MADRYFLAPMLCWMVCLVWLMARGARPLRVFVGALLAVSCVVGMPSDWSYQPYDQLKFPAQVAQFERLPKGSAFESKINLGRHMTLVKH